VGEAVTVMKTGEMRKTRRETAVMVVVAGFNEMEWFKLSW
jgi:hypothetical protein